MAELKAKVGPEQRNDPADVRHVQERLNRHRQWLGSVSAPPVDGRYTHATAQAVAAFQINGAVLPKADGIVAPGGFTLLRLDLDVIKAPKHRIFQGLCWAHPNDQLTIVDYSDAAARIGCEVAAIQAVASTEASGGPWTPDVYLTPVILYERHKFRQHTKPIGRFDSTHPDLSNRKPGGYAGSSHEHAKLRRAALLDEPAALKAASWGQFQILGENHRQAGFATVEAMVAAMMISRKQHLLAFAEFVANDSAMRKAIIAKDWASFARHYNGPKYAKHHYDTRIGDAYKRLSGMAGASR